MRVLTCLLPECLKLFRRLGRCGRLGSSGRWRLGWGRLGCGMWGRLGQHREPRDERLEWLLKIELFLVDVYFHLGFLTYGRLKSRPINFLGNKVPGPLVPKRITRIKCQTAAYFVKDLLYNFRIRSLTSLVGPIRQQISQDTMFVQRIKLYPTLFLVWNLVDVTWTLVKVTWTSCMEVKEEVVRPPPQQAVRPFRPTRPHSPLSTNIKSKFP